MAGEGVNSKGKGEEQGISDSVRVQVQVGLEQAQVLELFPSSATEP